MTFIYKGIISSYTITKKSAPKGKKVLSKKRKAEGVTLEEDKYAGYVSDERNGKGSDNAPPSDAFAYLV
jgi:hypothetical protein